jgi:hypothetical protein
MRKSGVFGVWFLTGDGADSHCIGKGEAGADTGIAAGSMGSGRRDGRHGSRAPETVPGKGSLSGVSLLAEAGKGNRACGTPGE